MASCSQPTQYGRCRKCQACIDNKISSWVLRMYLESLLYAKHMVSTCTLTYKNNDLPADSSEAKKQFQKFMKRLRRDLGFDVRYFAALEKGDQTARFHWHVIFYGLPVSYESKKYLDNKWGHGFVRRFERVKSASGMRYAAKYALKDKCYLMSRKPGLGDGMIDSINLTIDKLSKEEKEKIIGRQKPTEFLDRALGINDDKKLFTILSLRLEGYYYPLHDYIRKRLRRFR